MDASLWHWRLSLPPFHALKVNSFKKHTSPEHTLPMTAVTLPYLACDPPAHFAPEAMTSLFYSSGREPHRSCPPPTAPRLPTLFPSQQTATIAMRSH